MFGLTRREQRWKAEQQAAELLVGLASAAIKATADVEVARAAAKKDEELAALRAELRELKEAIAAAKEQQP